MLAIPASGTVPATLSLTLGAPATFGAFTAGVAHVYDASMTANVISTAGDATLSVAGPSSTATGHLVNGRRLLTFGGPISNDPVAIAFKQAIGANEHSAYRDLQQDAHVHPVHHHALTGGGAAPGRRARHRRRVGTQRGGATRPAISVTVVHWLAETVARARGPRDPARSQ